VKQGFVVLKKRGKGRKKRKQAFTSKVGKASSEKKVGKKGKKAQGGNKKSTTP